jgi:hypothetical protein
MLEGAIFRKLHPRSTILVIMKTWVMSVCDYYGRYLQVYSKGHAVA